MREAAIVATARTPSARRIAAISTRPRRRCSGHVMNAAVERAGIDPARIDDVFWGVGNQWGTQGGNAGRMAIFAGGCPTSVPAFTLDRKCGSGLTAIALAARSIMCDEIDVALAGGMESISLTMTRGRRAIVNQSVIAQEPAAYIPMIETAEIVAERYGISREAQDASPREPAARRGRAGEGRFRRGDRADHGRKGAVRQGGNQTGTETVTGRRTRAYGRHDAEALRGLKTGVAGRRVHKAGPQRHRGQCQPALRRRLRADPDGPQDGRGRGQGDPGHLSRFPGGGCEPDEMGIGPVFAIPKLLARAGLSSPTSACGNSTRRSPANASIAATPRHRSREVNVNGGAIAVGHPFGMTGAGWSAMR
jgi:acetyl-CoA C-acetyltransferase